MPLLGILLSQYWKPVALAVLIASALAYRTVLLHERDDARAQAAQLSAQAQAQAQALRVANQAFGATVDRQNQAVAQLKARADAVENALTAREKAAAGEAAAAQDEAAQQGRALTAAPIDVTAGCDGAIKWANARGPELSSW